MRREFGWRLPLSIAGSRCSCTGNLFKALNLYLLFVRIVDSVDFERRVCIGRSAQLVALRKRSGNPEVNLAVIFIEYSRALAGHKARIES